MLRMFRLLKLDKYVLIRGRVRVRVRVAVRFKVRVGVRVGVRVRVRNAGKSREWTF